MASQFLLLGSNLSYIVDLFVALHELASASVRTLLKLASSMCVLLKPYGDTIMSKTMFVHKHYNSWNMTLRCLENMNISYFYLELNAIAVYSARASFNTDRPTGKFQIDANLQSKIGTHLLLGFLLCHRKVPKFRRALRACIVAMNE